MSLHVTLNVFLDPWSRRFLQRSTGLEVRPWMLKQVQHDEIMKL